ncbi:phytanoyl-CoA dioxygenase family protein [Marinibaculum pumilum]|uniref:Phytanoyl-CoA dioxygenase family protein n=1 Tax=Marinibaculum pumilum TaxID=1766165 RepID=A0ABV7L648_9PROT
MPIYAESDSNAPLPGAFPVAGQGGHASAVAQERWSEADITVAPADYEAAAACLTKAGVVLLRGAIGRGVVEQVQQATARAFERLPQVAPAGDDAARELMRLSMIGPGLTAGFPELLALARRAVEGGVGRPILEHYLGGPLIPDTSTLRFRCHRPSQNLSFVPLHQDVAFTTHDRSWVNFWVPLTPCGHLAPGLQVFPLSRAMAFPHNADATPGGYPMGHISEETMASWPIPLSAIEPVFEPGDLLMFDGFCPHRTVERPGMTQVRMSFEFRYTSHVSRGPIADGPRQERRRT